MAIVPYSGQVSYNDIRSQFGSPSNFNLQSAYNDTYGGFNAYSYIQPANNPGGSDYSPNQWYGYVGDYIYSSNLVTVWDAWPTIGSYPGSGNNISDTSGNKFTEVTGYLMVLMTVLPVMVVKHILILQIKYL
jgi:hypothetical protein